MHCVPGGMQVLNTLKVQRCQELASDWLPDSSKARLHTLKAASSNVKFVPEGLSALQDLDVSDCHLAFYWLPASSASGLQILDVSYTWMQRLPDTLLALEEVDVSRCRILASDWLPARIAAGVRKVFAAGSALQ
jgi:hypothetical protein